MYGMPHGLWKNSIVEYWEGTGSRISCPLFTSCGCPPHQGDRDCNSSTDAITKAIKGVLDILDDGKCRGTVPPGVFGRRKLQQSSIFDLGQIKVSETLHPVFAAFLNDVRSMRLDNWAPEVDANTVSVDLCKRVADSFLPGASCCYATVPEEAHGRIYICLLELGRRFSWERSRRSLNLESHICNMQVSRSYQALVHNLKGQGQASDGVPCILLAVCGRRQHPNKLAHSSLWRPASLTESTAPSNH